MSEGLATTHDQASHPALRHHFENMEQQREAGTLGMWVFLVTEVMFFGGMFLAYTLYRSQYPAAFVSASNHLDIKLGAINTGVLIVSSFTMAGMHALHMIIGLGIMTVILIMAWRGKFSPEYHAPVEISGLYWHFVDIIWIFLFPLLYLLGRHLEGHIG